jgi:hypothetical protein
MLAKKATKQKLILLNRRLLRKLRLKLFIFI